MLIQGTLSDAYLKYASYICEYFANIHKGSVTSSVHYWIDSITDRDLRFALDALRNANGIKEQIQTAYAGYSVLNVPSSDEVYISVDPSKRKNSDVALSDCHYDAPFKYVPQCGNKFIRIILALNENNTTFTTVEDKTSTLSTLDFNGIDYNNDFHCVQGYIPKDKVRILLKLHFLCVHPGSSVWCANFTEGINDKWTHISRELMRRSAQPQTFTDHALSYVIQTARYTYNNSNIILVAAVCVILGFVVYDHLTKKPIINKNHKLFTLTNFPFILTPRLV